MSPKNMLVRTLATVAAGATALAGMLAIGAPANAVEGEPTAAPAATATCAATVGDATITINATDANQLKANNTDNKARKFVVIRIGTYQTDGNDNFTGIKSNYDQNNPVLGTGRDEGITANYIVTMGLSGMTDDGGGKYDPNGNVTQKDPWGWISTRLSNGDGQDSGVRQFVDGIDRTAFFSLTDNLPTGTTADQQNSTIRAYISREGANIHDPATQPTIGGVTVNQDGSGSVTINLGDRNAAGMYLIYDLTGDVTFGTKTYSTSKTMLVGTPLNSTGTDCTPIPNSDGVVNIKNQFTQKGDFTFTKVDADGNGLSGAGFVIKNSEGHYGTFVDGKWTFDAATTADTATEIQSGQGGTVTFTGLSAGRYTVEEKTVPTGYLQDAKPSFEVNISFGADGNLMYSATGTGNYKGLVFGDQENGPITSGLKVRNVTSKNQLPNTGSTGIMLFAVVAVLLAGGAGVTFVRSRTVKRSLR